MSTINISNLTFCYDGGYENIFENVSLCLDTAWKLGLTGRNGRGKTTLLKLLIGEYEYKGSITADVEFAYFPFEISDKSKLGIEAAEEIRPDLEYWQLSKELHLLGLDDEILYRPFDTLSGGERTKLMLALLFAEQNNFLLIDEPTNHLDAKGREKVGEYLNSKKGFILVSHDRRFIDSCVDHMLAINKANIELQQGNFSSWYHNKQMQDNFEINKNEKLKGEIKRLSSAAKQSKAWADKVEGTKIGKNAVHEIGWRAYAGEKSRSMQQRRKNLETRQERAIEEKSSLLKNIESSESLKIFPLKFGRTIITAKDLAMKYDGERINKAIGFDIKDGDRIVLRGANGCGKSSIIKAIACGGIDFDGRLEKGSGVVISYVPQDASFLSGSLRDFARERDFDETLFMTILRKMDFARSQFDNNMENYSEGQKKKILIAASLCQKAHLYIWDEPLNYIDVFSRMQTEELINEFSPTMLLVEHDAEFCENIGANIIEIEGSQ